MEIKKIKEIAEIFDERKSEIKWENKVVKIFPYLGNEMLFILHNREDKPYYFRGKPSGITNMNSILLLPSPLPYDSLIQSVHFRDIVAVYVLPGLESRLESGKQEQIGEPAFLRKGIDIGPDYIKKIDDIHSDDGKPGFVRKYVK